jgi:hypothetical protein
MKEEGEGGEGGKGERGKGKGMEIKSYLNHSNDIFLFLSPFPFSLSPN